MILPHLISCPLQSYDTESKYTIDNMKLPLFLSGFGPGEIGYLVQADKAVDVMAIVTSATNQSTDSMMKRVRAARELYTYAGLLEQIEKWFRDPFGPRGGFLRCHIKDRKSAFVEAISPL